MNKCMIFPILYLYLSIFSNYLFITSLSIPSILQSIHPSIYSFIHSFIHPSILPSFYPSILSSYSVFFQRAEQLRLRQEQLQVTSSIKQEPNYEENTKEIKNVILKNEVKEEEEEEEEEVDLDELLDWRSKHSS